MKMRYKKHLKNNSIYKPKLPTLKCTCCGNYYHAWWTSSQATHCASYFYINEDNEYAIYASYPSGFDDTRFQILNQNIVQQRHIFALNNREFTKDKWGNYDDSKIVVCDFCIRKFLNKNSIRIDTKYDPYEVTDQLNSFYDEDPILYMQIMNSGPSECMQLINQERAKPMDQRMKEKELRYKPYPDYPNGFIISINTL